MKLTLDIIVHELERSFAHVEHAFERGTSVRSVRLYGGSRVLDSGLLYVCERSCLPDANMVESVPFAFVGSKNDAPAGCAVVIETDISTLEVFAIIQGMFERYASWCAAMDRLLFEDGELQELFDLAEPFLKNSVVAVDATFRLLAHTRRVSCDDPVTVALIENGYHTEDNIRRFRLHKRFRAWETEASLIVNDSREICLYDTVTKSFKSRGSLSLIVVMVCSNIEPQPWLLDSFELFLQRVDLYNQRQYSDDRPAGLVLDIFLRDLVSGSIMDSAFIEQEARRLGIPENRVFCAFFIGLPDDPAFPAKRVVSDVTFSVAPAKVLIVEDGIVVLCFNCPSAVCTGVCAQDGSTTETRLARVLRSFGLSAGRSSAFFELEGLHVAHRQARAAHAVLEGRKRGNEAVQADADNILSYDSCYLDCLLDASYSEQAPMLEASSMLRVIEHMAADDMANNTDNLTFMVSYLAHERRGTLVGEKVHMHRNNVKKRADRISAIYGIDTEDAFVRWSFMISYAVWRARP